MGLQPFEPSLDWGNELTASLWWLARAWVISAVCVFGLLVVLRFATQWGRQYWRITSGYFTGARAVRTWLMVGVLLLSVITSVRLTVLFSYVVNDLNSALQAAFEGMGAQNNIVKQSGVHGFWTALLIVFILAALFTGQAIADLYLTQRFIIAWRVWLTDHLTSDWLDGHAYYRARFIDETIDNPDQRIQQDIDMFTAGAGGTPNMPTNGTSSTLLFGAVGAVASVISFSAILWNLSGALTIPLLHVEIPRAMFWIVIVFVLLGTIVAFWIGHPLIDLSVANEKLNAAFRYALVRLRDAAEAVGFYHGEQAERTRLWQRFTTIIDNYRRYVRRTVAYTGWNASVDQITFPLPYVIQAPRLFAGKLDLGGLVQTATAFSSIQGSLS
ncbi:MAG: ABC transporter ATP-binding protein/permease, partial [Mycobacterium sp.]|nr:ABC transporter ATP-binding protein/permease [Mycobacterium sp.]MBV9720567.1 ABC transporter ATP-binding protein/permease [Mycobacterium sp.]